MTHEHHFTPIVVAVVVVCSVVAVATGPVGTAAAQSGSIDLQNSITPSTNEFTATVTSLQGTEFDTGCVVVFNSNAETFYRQEEVPEGETVTVTADDVGGLDAGDQITAELYADPQLCERRLDADTTTVREPAFFEVRIDEVDDSVSAGDPVTLSYTIENTGGSGDTQDVAFTADGSVVETTTVDLAPGDTFSNTVTYQTDSNDPPSVLLAVQTDDAMRERTVQVEESSDPASFDVSIDSTNSPVTAGNALAVSATIENTGDESDSQVIALRIDGEAVDTTRVELGAGASTAETFQWATEAGDGGEYTATVQSEDDTDSTAVQVRESANFDVTIDATNAPVTEGETVEVVASVQNTGGQFDTQQVGLQVDGETVYSVTLELEPGQSATRTFRWSTGDGDAGSYVATVASNDDSDAADVEVVSEAAFDVTMDGTNSPVTAGDALTVTATVENTGEEADSQDVVLRVDGEVVDTATVELAGGESRTVEFAWQTGSGDAGTYTAAVESADDTATTAVEVVSEAAFDVSIDGTNSPVDEGDTLTVLATVENTGDEGASQEVTLAIGDETVDGAVVELAGGGSRTVEFAWQTQTGDAGTYTATVGSADDQDSTTVQVEGQAGFRVEIEETNEPVGIGETLNVTATVENTGEDADSQEVRLVIGDETVDSTVVTLGGRESRTLSFTWTPEPGESGSYVAAVKGADDSATVDVRVEETTSFLVAVQATTAPVVSGEQLAVDVRVENVGEESGTKEVRMAVDGSVVDILSVTLDAGEAVTVTMLWDSAGATPGEYTAEVSSDVDSDTTAFRVVEQGDVGVRIDGTNSPVTVGESLTVVATAQNTGGTTKRQSIDLGIDGRVVDTTTVTLAGNESRTVELAWETTEADAGEYTAAVSSDDDTATAPVQVATAPEFVVAIDETGSPVTAGTSLSVTATVENTGGTSDTQDVRLAVDGAVRTSQSVTLEPGATTTVELTWETTEADAGEYTAEVSSDNDTATAGVQVTEPGGGSDGADAFEVTVESTNSPVGGGDRLDVTATVENTGSRAGTGQISLRVGDTERDSQSVSLDAGESQTLTLAWATEAGDAGEYTAVVAAPADEATSAVTVGTGGGSGTDSTFAVSIDEVSTPDGETGEFAVTATIENTGDTADTQTVTLTTSGTERDSQSVSLDAGGSQTLTFRWTQSGAGEVDIEVSSETDSDRSVATVDSDGDGPVSTTSILLLVLLLLILAAAYYYVRRRQRREATTYDEPADDGTTDGGEKAADDPEGAPREPDTDGTGGGQRADDPAERETRLDDGDKNK